MDRETLMQFVEERLVDSRILVSKRVMEAIVDATIAALVDGGEVNADRCACCSTRILTVEDAAAKGAA